MNNDLYGLGTNNSSEKCLVGLAYNNQITPQFFNPIEFEKGCAELHGDTTLGTGAI